MPTTFAGHPWAAVATGDRMPTHLRSLTRDLKGTQDSAGSIQCAIKQCQAGKRQTVSAARQFTSDIGEVLLWHEVQCSN